MSKLFATIATLAVGVASTIATADAQVVRRLPAAMPSAMRAAAPMQATPAERARAHASANRKWHRSLHTAYGTIASMTGDTLMLHLRDGHSLTVDATIAVANDAYSAPLFVGKMVSVEGAMRGNVFAANDIFRVDTLAGLPPDR